MYLTETGAYDPMNAMRWYGMLKAGELGGVKEVAWYAMDHHKGYELIDDKFKPSALYAKMSEDAES